MTLFPENFVWGAASSAYQIEGQSLADGGGASIWDTFSHTEGKTFQGNNGDVACGSYAHPEWDLENLKAMGLKAYRFSTSWARIDPRGDGSWNEAGIAYYDRVVDGLLANGITPYLTCYHWELPQALEDKGGWENRETVESYARFVGMLAAHFKGRVGHYFLLNEPQCTVGLGYGTGVHAPGKQLPKLRLFEIHKNLLLAYGMGSQAVRQADPGAQVGLATAGRIAYPLTEADVDVARKATFEIFDEDWIFTHSMFLDPLCFGRFPDCAPGELKTAIDGVSPEEMAIIFQKPDFLGFNIYNGWGVRDKDGEADYVKRCDGFPRTALKWPITPEALDYGMYFMWERYGLACYVTENGLSCADVISLDGKVHDPNRIDFLHRYLLQLNRAIERGADIAGYFHWALTDNFEWHSGYAERFGLVFVDYPTQKRILKDSAAWYAQVAASNGRVL